MLTTNGTDWEQVRVSDDPEQCDLQTLEPRRLGSWPSALARVTSIDGSQLGSRSIRTVGRNLSPLPG